MAQLLGVAAASSVLPPRLPTLSAVLLVPGDVRLGRISCSVATTLLRLRTPTNAEGDGGFVCGDEPSSSSSVGSCPDPDEPEPAPAVSWAGLAPGAGTARRLGLCCCDRFHRTWIPASATERALPVVGVGIMDARRRALPFGRPEDDEDSAERVARGEEVPGGVTGRGVGGGCMSRKYSKHAVIVVMQKLCVGHAVATCRHHIVRRGRPACVRTPHVPTPSAWIWKVRVQVLHVGPPRCHGLGRGRQDHGPHDQREQIIGRNRAHLCCLAAVLAGPFAGERVA